MANGEAVLHCHTSRDVKSAADDLDEGAEALNANTEHGIWLREVHVNICRRLSSYEGTSQHAFILDGFELLLTVFASISSLLFTLIRQD